MCRSLPFYEAGGGQPTERVWRGGAASVHRGVRMNRSVELAKVGTPGIHPSRNNFVNSGR